MSQAATADRLVVDLPRPQARRNLARRADLGTRLLDDRHLLNNRLALLTDYPFQRLAALLDGVSPPLGLDPISFAIGEPKHRPPEFINPILAAHAHEWNRYPPTAGSADLRAAIADWLTARYGLPADRIDAERHVLPVAGTREALFMAALLCVPERKGGGRSVVLMPNPLYQVYAGAALMAGAETVLLPATRETGFLPDLAAVPADILARTALLYLCSPSNPEGAVASPDQLRQAIDLARRHDFVIAFDHCYADIYDDVAPASALEVCADGSDGMDNVLVFHSLSKRSSVPGLRSGFVAGSALLIDAFTRLRAYGGATTPLPIMAAAAALWRDEAHVAENRALYRAKFDSAEHLLGNRFGFYRPAGGFYLWLDVGDGEAAARRLWAEGGVRTLPGAYLARPGSDGINPGSPYIRVSLVDELAPVKRGLERLAKIL